MQFFNNVGLTKRSAFWFEMLAICLALLAGVQGRPQDLLESIGFGAVQIAAQAADIASKGGALRDDRGFEVPFVKAHSKSEAGVGEAMIQRSNDDSSEEDRRRRKRSLDSIYVDLMESFSTQPHVHRFKRSPCMHGTTGTGGGAGTGGTDGGDDIDVVERRKKAARKAAQRKKARNSKKTTGKTKKHLVNDDEEPSLSRRKRQSEVDDLNANMSGAGKDLSQHAQQFVEKVRGAWENFINSMSQMAEQVKKAFQSAAGGDGDQMTGDI